MLQRLAREFFFTLLALALPKDLRESRRADQEEQFAIWKSRYGVPLSVLMSVLDAPLFAGGLWVHKWQLLPRTVETEKVVALLLSKASLVTALFAMGGCILAAKVALIGAFQASAACFILCFLFGAFLEFWYNFKQMTLRFIVVNSGVLALVATSIFLGPLFSFDLLPLISELGLEGSSASLTAAVVVAMMAFFLLFVYGTLFVCSALTAAIFKLFWRATGR